MHRLQRAVLLFSTILCIAGASLAQQSPQPTAPFRLHDGDVVVFYGDSITEQKLYTTDIENFVLTRFPGLHVRFVNSGVGGDKVSGGWAGPIDLRLRRDLFDYHPTMVTVMLGMNDGFYRPFDEGILTTFTVGYRYLVEQIQTASPQTSLTLLKPSPYDDVTRETDFDPAYNTTMVRFGDFVGKLAEEKHTLLVDLNQPVVKALTAAKSVDPILSTAMIRDRVHPGPAIHLLMAETVLKAWNAPAVVTSVRIDAVRGKVNDTANTDITQVQRTKDGLTWVQSDHALPLPFGSAETDPCTELLLRVSDLNQRLNQEMLRIDGLSERLYELRIDDRSVGTFTAAQLAEGINLATLDTPMLAQARLVAFDTVQKNELAGSRFQIANDAHDAKSEELVKRLGPAIDRVVERQRKDAQPVPHRYALLRSAEATPTK
jgi:lysophospholipase L1-like esterase